MGADRKREDSLVNDLSGCRRRAIVGFGTKRRATMICAQSGTIVEGLSTLIVTFPRICGLINRAIVSGACSVPGSYIDCHGPEVLSSGCERLGEGRVARCGVREWSVRGGYIQ